MHPLSTPLTDTKIIDGAIAMMVYNDFLLPIILTNAGAHVILRIVIINPILRNNLIPDRSMEYASALSQS